MSKGNALLQKFHDLRDALNGELLERADVIDTALLALISRKHHFQVGPPGVAKSALVIRLVARIGGLTEQDVFYKLLTRTTVEDEIFGAPDITEMLQNSVYVRNMHGRLPQAKIAFLDEIFKGGSTVLNALLLAMNERQFDSEGDKIDIPLNTMFGASNELAEGDELAAMWDRLHFRHVVDPLKDNASFIAMLQGTFVDDPEPLITMEEIEEAQELCKDIPIPLNIIQALRDLQQTLEKKHAVRPTDRRWREALDIIKANAWYHGCDEVEIIHTRVLMHILWDAPEHIDRVMDSVLGLADPMERDAQECLNHLIQLNRTFDDEMTKVDTQSARNSVSVEITKKLEDLKTEMKKLATELKDQGRELPLMNVFDREYRGVSAHVLEVGMGVKTKGIELVERDGPDMGRFA